MGVLYHEPKGVNTALSDTCFAKSLSAYYIVDSKVGAMSTRTITLLLAGLLTAGAFLAGRAIPNRASLSDGTEYTAVGPSVVAKVRKLAALTTIEVVESTTIEKGNDYGWLNWARGDRVFMFVVAKIGAGIDFEQLHVESFDVDERTGAVTVRMPPAHITYVAMDNEQTQVIDRDTGLFTKGDPKLETDARQVAERVLRRAALDAGILGQADRNARAAIEGLLLELGYQSVVFTEGRQARSVSP